MAAPNIPVHANQVPRLVSHAGIKLRADTAYTDQKGQEQQSIRVRTEADIERLQEVLSKILEPEEVIFYVLSVPTTARDFEKLVFTNHRLLFFCAARDGTWKRSISRGIHWPAVANTKVKGWFKRSLALTYRNRVKESYDGIQDSGKKLRVLLGALLPATTSEAAPTEGLVTYCPGCFSTLAPKAPRCARCGLATVSGSAWDPNAISFIGFFFSFLPAGVMHALNYERLGYPEKKKPRLILFIAGFVVLLATTLAVPIPGLFTAINIAIAISFFQIAIAIFFYQDQRVLFQRHLAMGGEKASIALPLAFSFLWLLIVGGGFWAGGFLELGGYQRQFDEGVQRLNSGDYEEAETIFTEIKAKHPEELAAYWNLALIYLNTGRLDMAKRELEELRRHDPNYEGPNGMTANEMLELINVGVLIIDTVPEK